MLLQSYKEINENYDQKFYYPPLSFGSVSTNRIFELLNHKVISKNEVKVMQYLYKFKFASLDMIVKYVLSDLDDKDKFKQNLIHLVKQRILNMFIMTDEDPENIRFSYDGEIFFTLDFGAIVVLRSLLKDENIDDFKTTDLMMHGSKVAKYLMCQELYFRLLRDCPNALKYYVPSQNYAVYQTKFENKATFKVGDNVYFLETITESDIYDGSDSKLFAKLTKYEKFLDSDKIWQYYFDNLKNAPILILLCDTYEAASKMAPQIAQLSIPYVRYICLDTDKPMKEAFYKFENNSLIPILANSFSN